jgi:hypothetical protein
VVESIVSTVEPEAWDYGQFDYYEEDERSGDPTARDLPSGGGATKPESPSRLRPRRPRYVEIQKPAIIRHWRDVLIVYAPPYIHRQIGGVAPPRR